MKRISIFLVALSLCGVTQLRAQDAATEERVKKLNGLVQDLQESKEIQRKQIENLSKEIQALREQMAKPTGNYASQDDLRDLAKKLQEIDDKRKADNERIIKEIEKLGKKMTTPSGGSKPRPQAGEKATDNISISPHYEHIVASGDTISTIAQAFREQGVKVTEKQILAANPGLVPEKMKVGQKLIIPKPEK